MHLFFDSRDSASHASRGIRMHHWLIEMGAEPLSTAERAESGFLFAGTRTIDDYRKLMLSYPKLADQPAAREQLLRLDSVLDALQAADAHVPTPRTWRLAID